MTEINLSTSEMLVAAQAGVLRQIQNVQANKSDTYGCGHENDWQLHVEGALVEFALAKYLGEFWGGKGIRGQADVGQVDVRSTSRDNGSLILHMADPDDRTFYLLTGINGRYVVRGHILGRDGKDKKYWADPSGKGRPAFFVPQSALIKPGDAAPQAGGHTA